MIGAMFGDVFRSLFRRPVTEQYPFERKPAPARLRGKLQYDAGKCTHCRMCVRDCPSSAIEILVLDKANKRYAMSYRVDRCIFCSQCVHSCRFGCLSMACDDWELAACTKGPFAVSYGVGEGR